VHDVLLEMLQASAQSRAADQPLDQDFDAAEL